MIKDIEFLGLSNAAAFFKNSSEVTEKAASLAINQVTTRKALPLAATTISEQIAFPKDYLKGDRLSVSKYAKPNDLEAVILARKRATSLARFAGGSVIGRAGVKVEVTRGKSSYLRNAWLVRLKKGASLEEDRYNVGLAVRVKPGESVKYKKSFSSDKQSWLVKDRVALLYGPSVEQVFRDVADDISPRIGTELATEFLRQFDRLT